MVERNKRVGSAAKAAPATKGVASGSGIEKGKGSENGAGKAPRSGAPKALSAQPAQPAGPNSGPGGQAKAAAEAQPKPKDPAHPTPQSGRGASAASSAAASSSAPGTQQTVSGSLVSSSSAMKAPGVVLADASASTLQPSSSSASSSSVPTGGLKGQSQADSELVQIEHLDPKHSKVSKLQTFLQNGLRNNTAVAMGQYTQDQLIALAAVSSLPVRGGDKGSGSRDAAASKPDVSFKDVSGQDVDSLESSQEVFLGGLTAEVHYGCVHLTHLFVTASARRRGIGRRLLSELLTRTRGSGWNSVFVETFSFEALYFFQKSGFAWEYSRNGYSGNLSLHYMRLDLAAGLTQLERDAAIKETDTAAGAMALCGMRMHSGSRPVKVQKPRKSNGRIGKSNHNKKMIEILRKWYDDHKEHPYPTEADQYALAEQTGLSEKEINTWFINTRKRMRQKPLAKLLAEVAAEQENLKM